MLNKKHKEAFMANQRDFFRIGRTGISVTDEDNAIQTVLDSFRNKQKEYDSKQKTLSYRKDIYLNNN